MSQLFTYFTADCAHGLKHNNASKAFGDEVAQELNGFLSGLSQDNFVQDVQNALQALKGATTKSLTLQAYAKALGLVVLPYLEGQKVSSKGEFAKAAVEFVKNKSFHEVLREVKTVAAAAGVSIAELQIATDVDTQTRLAIRSDFYKKHSNTVLIITVQPDLLGGVRLFKDNTVVDMSWNSQLQSILSV